MLYRLSTGSLITHNAFPPQDSYWEHRRPQLISIPNQIPQTDMDPDQISTTDASPGPIILLHRRRSLPWRRNQSQLTWSPTKYMQHTSGFPWYPSGLEQFCCQTPKLLPKFPIDAAAARIIPNWHRGSLKYCQLAPGLLNPVLWILQGCLKYLLMALLWRALWKHWQFVSSKYFLPVFLWSCGSRTLFRLK